MESGQIRFESDSTSVEARTSRLLGSETNRHYMEPQWQPPTTTETETIFHLLVEEHFESARLILARLAETDDDGENTGGMIECNYWRWRRPAPFVQPAKLEMMSLFV